MNATEIPLLVSMELAALPDAVVRVRHFRVDERLSAPYRATVTIETDTGDFDAEQLRGTDARLVLTRPGSERALCGVLREVQDGRGSGGHHVAELVIEPALAHLGLVRNTRIFQEMDAPTILQEVLSAGLGPYGREVRLSLEGTYAVREHCVQYQETDLSFAERLMEEEGIAYAFDHVGDKEVLVLTDANAAFARADGASDPLELGPLGAALGEHEALHRFVCRETTTTTSVAVRDYDWTLPSFAVDGEARGDDALGRDRESYEHGWGRSATLGSYDAGARRYQEHDTAHRATVRREGLVAQQRVGHGVGRVVGLRPGTTFELVGHPTVGLDGEYLVTSVLHESRSAEEALGHRSGEGHERYHNRFECVPLAVPFRPARRAPKPRIPSIQTAVVTGPAGEEIHTDEHGRIKVRFLWDRLAADDDTSSCWVRVQQKWAGAGWGFFWLPRVGMEVVVQFVDGDPDRPLVTGAVYDATHATPYPLPDDKTKSTIKSNSSPGGGGYNELRFEDKAGSEEIFTHAQKDYDEVVENNHDTLVHGHQTIEVDNDQRQTIHGNQTERVDGNQDLGVGGNRSIHAESNYDETVDGTETRVVSGDVTESFSASEQRSVAGNLDETIGGSETRNVQAAQTETIGGSVTRSVGGSSNVTVTSTSSQTVAGGIEVTTPATWTVTAVGGLNITAPAGFHLTAPGGLRVAAPGGVKQIDGTSDLIASLCFKDGGSVRNAIGRKNEWIGLHISVVGQTNSAGLFHLTAGLKFEAKATEDGTAGADNGAGAVDASASTASSTA